jgi:hypothetical protein
MRRKRKRYFEREILGAARNIEHGAALVRSGQAGSRPSHNQSSRATHSAHCRQQRQLPKRRARGMMIGPRHAVEEIAHPWEGGHSEASAALVAGFGPSNGTFKNAEPPPHSPPGACMYAEPRAGMPACIRYLHGKVGRCGSSYAKHQRHPTSSCRNVAHLFPQPDISAWWPGRAWPRNSHFPFTPTCCGTHAGSSSPTTAMILAPSKPFSGTARSCPPSDTPL